ncbi:large conductance mechanosensitive channel protein MscL [Leptothoe sp. ISB3NOV94-8A]|uniref:Large-conductance mechanosensitive channel n=1 Tax=Adonisia turfae CCMR0081 TaxID=2292702 RepID=A0A6M0RIT0_9CYAN|nr:large conductance mechanosensitive channel protein MscL [Adonisia turfae]MDV3353293.1 large conductance mechanosensitive channel protein MscL [Leptothoe sp. LEGE 181152]NEZ56178.1 large conductance mechanosensitive channel protein MscL [Adonisia turfae CCMR0081]
MVSNQARSRAVNSAGSFMNDFREFLLRGNVVDLAVAVVIGGAFGAVITSFIEDIITPLLLSPALNKAGVADIAELSANGVKYGLFLSTVINFVVIAFILFVLIRTFERMKRTEEVDAGPSTDEKLNDTLGRLTGFLEQRM